MSTNDELFVENDTNDDLFVENDTNDDLLDETERAWKKRLTVHLFRARSYGLPATLTMDQWRQSLRDFDGRCAFCGDPADVMEHFVPLEHGSGTTAGNCLPGCDKCNGRKGGGHPDEFRFVMGEALTDRLTNYLASRSTGNDAGEIHQTAWTISIRLGRDAIDLLDRHVEELRKTMRGTTVSRSHAIRELALMSLAKLYMPDADGAQLVKLFVMTPKKRYVSPASAASTALAVSRKRGTL